MIYFDNTATSPIDSEVLDAMLPYLKEEYGNPSSKYYCKSINAKNAVEEARVKIAMLIGASPESIVFTSGASESTNLIIKGYLDYRKYYVDGKNHIITSKVEHKATLNTCKYLNGEIYSNNDPTVSLFGNKSCVDRGFEASFLDVDSTGAVMIQDVESNIKDTTAMVSIIHANNEIGTLNDIAGISDVCHEHDIAFHSDITQSLGKTKINVEKLGLDYASCSAHKIYGPKGIGAAYLKTDSYGISPISSLIHGGEQENGYRAGTYAVHNIVGFGKAAEIALKNLETSEQRIEELDAYLVSELKKVEDIRLTNEADNRLKGIVSVIIDRNDFNNERFIKNISDQFALSTGSACSAGEPSYVINAIGMKEYVSKVVRISLNKYTTQENINQLVFAIKKHIEKAL